VARKATGFGLATVLGAVLLIMTARLLVGHVSWGVRWIINAIGWLTIAAVIIPFCNQVKQSRRGKK
jgi:hypothetical protein